MTTNRLYWLAIVALLAGALLLGRVTAQEATVPTNASVAVCNIATVFNNYQRAKDLTAKLEKKKVALNEEDTRRNQAIETLQSSLDKLNPGSEAYEAKLAEAEKLTLDLKSWREFEEAKLLREHRTLTEEMYRDILKVIDGVAAEQGYQLVLYRDDLDLKSTSTPELLSKIAQRKVLYSAASIDITDTILSRLNEQYKAKQ